MSTAVKVAGVGTTIVAFLIFVALMVAAPVLIVGAIVSAVFGLGFWVSTGYVFLARLAVRLLLGR